MGVVRVTSGATSKDVCQLADVKTALGIDASDTSQDATLERIISSVGSEFAGPAGLNRPPWRQTYSEDLSASGGVELRLTQWPIESVSSLVDSDGGSIDSSTFQRYGERYDRLYSSDGWRSQRPIGDVHLEFLFDYTAAYIGGWLMSGQVADFETDKAYVLGDWVRATDISILQRFVCTTAGTSGPTEDSWNETGDTTQGGAIFSATEASEWPLELENAAISQSADQFRALSVDPNIAAESFETMRTQYRIAERDLGGHIRQILWRYR